RPLGRRGHRRRDVRLAGGWQSWRSWRLERSKHFALVHRLPDPGDYATLAGIVDQPNQRARHVLLLHLAQAPLPLPGRGLERQPCQGVRLTLDLRGHAFADRCEEINYTARTLQRPVDSRFQTQRDKYRTYRGENASPLPISAFRVWRSPGASCAGTRAM